MLLNGITQVLLHLFINRVNTSRSGMNQTSTPDHSIKMFLNAGFTQGRSNALTPKCILFIDVDKTCKFFRRVTDVVNPKLFLVFINSYLSRG